MRRTQRNSISIPLNILDVLSLRILYISTTALDMRGSKVACKVSFKKDLAIH